MAPRRSRRLLGFEPGNMATSFECERSFGSGRAVLASVDARVLVLCPLWTLEPLKMFAPISVFSPKAGADADDSLSSGVPGAWLQLS